MPPSWQEMGLPSVSFQTVKLRMGWGAEDRPSAAAKQSTPVAANQDEIAPEDSTLSLRGMAQP